MIFERNTWMPGIKPGMTERWFDGVEFKNAEKA
jgi:hypothetical protein